MKKSELIALLQEIDGDPDIYLESYHSETLNRELDSARKIYTDRDGDIVIMP